MKATPVIANHDISLMYMHIIGRTPTQPPKAIDVNNSEDASYLPHQYNSTLLGFHVDRRKTAYASINYNHVCPVSTVNATNVMVCFVIVWHQSIEWHTWGYYFTVFRGHIVKNITGGLLVAENRWTSIRIRAWMCNHIHVKQWEGVISNPCPNFNIGLVKLPLKLMHRCVITSDIKSLIWLLMHVQISVKWSPRI